MQNLFLFNCWLSCIDRFATENPVRRKKAKLINWNLRLTLSPPLSESEEKTEQK